jgi:hypothetical protein
VAIQFPFSRRATFIGGGGGCGGVGGTTGTDSDAAYWNDCELQEEVTNANSIASAARAAVEVSEWRSILGRDIDPSGRKMAKYRLRCDAEQQGHIESSLVLRECCKMRWQRIDIRDGEEFSA